MSEKYADIAHQIRDKIKMKVKKRKQLKREKLGKMWDLSLDENCSESSVTFLSSYRKFSILHTF